MDQPQKMKIALAGYGQEGATSYKYWHDLGATITIFDEKTPEQEIPEGADTCFQPDAYSHIEGFDLIIRTPGVNPNKIKSSDKIWSATNEFFKVCPAQIIGVTGTKGKGTTASLIAEILKQTGKQVHLLGNIGVPALSVLPDIKAEDIVVFELSSFQLWDLEYSPQTAVVLMIEPDHMDVHASMEEYIAAKSRIGAQQKSEDTLVYHPTNKYSAEIASGSIAKKIRYMTSEGAEVVDSEIYINNNKVCDVSEVGLIGPHNLENVCAAITAAWVYTQDLVVIKNAVTNFKGLSHRLEFAGTVEGIDFYNDSQATGVGSCIAALRSFNQPTVLILGGSDKGVDVSALLDELRPEKHKIILIGQSSTKLAALLDERKNIAYTNLGSDVTMQEVVDTAYRQAKPGSVVLLSPAHASFDMFKNYQERGNQFKAAVKNLQT